MRNIIVIPLLFLSIYACSQRLGVNNSDPDPSSILEVRSDSLGILIPRINESVKAAMNDPAEGLLIYQKDDRKGFYYFDGSLWRFISDTKINITDIDPSEVSAANIESYIIDQQAPLSTFYRYKLNSDVVEVWFWNGEKTIKISGTDKSNFKIYSSYNALREDTFNVYDLIFINDFYVDQDTFSHLVKGGFFSRKDAGKENGAIILVTNSGVVYERQWDGINVYPSWWEVNGLDHNGERYEDDYLWKGIENNGDRLWAATSFARQGMTIECDPYALYETAHRLILQKGVRINGNRATFKRKNISAILTANSVSGTNVYSVDNAEIFRKGMWISAFGDINVYGDQSHATPKFYMIIDKIEGNNISLTKNVGNTIDAGNKVTSVFDMMLCDDDDYIFNLIMDGNNQNLDATYSWNHLNGIFHYSNGGMTIDKCIFQNFHSDVIIAPAPLYIKDTEFINIAGSCIHGGDLNGENENSQDYNTAGIYIENCKFSNICYASASGNGHANQIGLYAQSIGTGNVVIENCYAENGNNGGIITPLNRASNHIKISDSYFGDFGHILTNISNSIITGLDIHNSTFKNCGVLNFEASIHADDKFYETNITNNRFTNCQIVLHGSDRLNFSGNNILYQPNDNFQSFELSKETFSNVGGLLTVSSSNSIVADNIFISRAFDSRAEAGILINSRNNDSFFNFTLNGNTVIGFPKGIEMRYSGNSRYYDNIAIKNNHIQTDFFESIDNSIGIIASNGAKLADNHIIHQNDSPAILFYGTNNNTQNILSGWVLNNICEGSNYENQIEIINENVFINNNYLTGKLDENVSSENNFVGINYQISQSQSPRDVVSTIGNRILIDTGEGAPTKNPENGSLYIDQDTGMWYIRINNDWKIIE